MWCEQVPGGRVPLYLSFPIHEMGVVSTLVPPSQDCWKKEGVWWGVSVYVCVTVHVYVCVSMHACV